ncbi:Ku70/Ku80 beta-barrel domain containing protein [Nitzschia inconspicua]|uniref:Ku70/Ku80 beta-barrel domain containing protein n=1 Tax=Nitzschia inconspicua TaxID=303405 RepID=A0A9K3LV55_9STRA|nr:Ku70/Ku80 beta-barrel domain containing protein [Nitzschia inconspicua]
MGDFFESGAWDNDLDFDFDSPDNGEDAVDGDDEDVWNFGAQHVVALVDCHPDMFVPVLPRPKEEEDSDDDDGDTKWWSSSKRQTQPATPFDLSIQTLQKLVETVIETTVIRKTGKRDGVGILLYNTKPQKRGRHDEADEEDDKMEEKEDVDDDDKMDEVESDDGDDEDDDSNSEDENVDAANQTNVHKLLDLVPPGIKQFRVLRTMVEKKGKDPKDEFCSTNTDHEHRQAPLQNAIEEAMRVFLKSKYVKDRNKAKKPEEIDSRAIWIFTNQANPYTSSLQQLINNVASEAKDQYVEFIIWPLASNVNGIQQSDSFVSPFFEALASAWLFDKRFQDMEELEQDGLAEIYRRMKKNRRIYHGPMHILHSSSSREAPIMIDWFSPVQLAKRPAKVQIDDETKLETNRIRICSTNDGKMFACFHAKPTAEQREIQKQQPGLARFRSFYYFVDELIPMQLEDSRQILKYANGGYDPGLTILGFKPRDSIPFFHSIHLPLIIYPNDDQVQGSSAAFAQLHAAMLRKNVVAVGEAHHRQSWQSRLVAVFPIEKSPSDEEMGRPAGMLVVKLPFEDDIRAIAPDEASKELEMLKARENHHTGDNKKVLSSDAVILEPPDLVGSAGNNTSEHFYLGSIATEDLVEAAMKMVSKLTVNKRSALVDVSNDAMDDFYSYLKSVALDLPREKNGRREKIDESMLPSKAKMAIQRFFQLLPEDVPPQKPMAGKKRTKDLPPDETGIDWKMLFETDKLSSCKNNELKACLRSLGEKSTGAKTELVHRLRTRLQKEYAESNAVKNEKDEI